MTWTVTREGPFDKAITGVKVFDNGPPPEATIEAVPEKLHVRAIIDIASEQDELKALIESLQKHLVDKAPV